MSTCIALRESPPRSKKLSRLPTAGALSTSAKIRAISVSSRPIGGSLLRWDRCGDEGSQFAAVDLARGSARQLRHLDDARRDLESCQPGAKKAAQFALADSIAQHDGGGEILAQRGMDDGERRRLDHLRVPDQSGFDLVGRDLRAPTIDDIGVAVPTGRRTHRDRCGQDRPF